MLATIARLALTVRPLHFIKRIISVLTDGNDVVVVVSEDVLGVGRSRRTVRTPTATALSMITRAGLAIGDTGVGRRGSDGPK